MLTETSKIEYEDSLDEIKKHKVKFVILIVTLLILLLISFILSMVHGSSSVGIKEVIATLLSFINISSWDVTEAQKYIVTELRMPRAVLAVFVGAAHAVGGVAMQGLFRNPLAAPDLLGVNAGASLGAALAIVFGLIVIPVDYLMYAVPIGAFSFAFIVALVNTRIATVGGRTNILVLLLCGIAITAIIGACMGLLVYVSDDSQLRDIIFWTLGDLSVAGWKEVIPQKWPHGRCLRRFHGRRQYKLDRRNAGIWRSLAKWHCIPFQYVFGQRNPDIQCRCDACK